MNSSFLNSAETPSADSFDTHSIDLEAFAADEATGFQDTLGNIKAPKRSFQKRFKIIRTLGRGGFGTTYLARDTAATVTATRITTAKDMAQRTPSATQGQSKGLPCVIKQLKYKASSHQTSSHQTSSQTASAPAQMASHSADFRQERIQRRFKRETRMMARLGRHRQMPCLLDHFIEDNQFYLVQEHIPGLTISQEITRNGVKSETEVKQFLTEMLPILRYIHRQNLLHLDLKPANIIRRSSDQTLVLIDFGAVRRYPDTSLSKAPERGSGTMGFAPSEQLAGKPTPASDIYALGVTCLYLLTKISPLDLATSPQGQNLRWQESVQLSPHFTRILSKMLNPDHTRRFQSIDELDRAMKLEAHYDTLQGCLNTAPLQQKKQPSVCMLPTRSAGDNTIQRQATSIRRWKQRRREFKSFTPR